MNQMPSSNLLTRYIGFHSCHMSLLSARLTALMLGVNEVLSLRPLESLEGAEESQRGSIT